MDPRLAEVFRDKPEMIIDPPPWMLPEAEAARLRDGAGVMVVELAGRDSVAGAVAALRQRPVAAVLPTYVFTGTEHGPWSWVEEALARLRASLPREVEIAAPVVLGSPGFWWAMNGRYLAELIARYGFSPLCVGCHLYLHCARLPLARMLGNAPIISGERESHDGRVKINQLAVALDAYADLAGEFGVELLLPIRGVADGGEIRELVGRDWPEGGEQLQCALSGNYRMASGEAAWDEARLSAYLEEFALPLARAVVGEYLVGRAPDHAALAGALLTG